jgi:hypothetical protein
MPNGNPNGLVAFKSKSPEFELVRPPKKGGRGQWEYQKFIWNSIWSSKWTVILINHIFALHGNRPSVLVCARARNVVASIDSKFELLVAQKTSSVIIITMCFRTRSTEASTVLRSIIGHLAAKSMSTCNRESSHYKYFVLRSTTE